jgi:hypothetical protein
LARAGLAIVLGLGAALAHDALEHYVLFTVRSTFRGGNLDTEVTAVFTGEGAKALRRTMDADADGIVSALEEAAILESLAASLSNGFGLEADGVKLATFLLYEPEMRLESERRVVQHPVTVRLSAFARWPKASDLPERLALDIRLFDHMPAIMTWEVDRSTSWDEAAVPLARVQATFGIKEQAIARTGRLTVTLPEPSEKRRGAR